MQYLLHESTQAAGERGLERPLCMNPIPPPMHQEEEDKGLVMMHAMNANIQRCIQGHAMQAELSKEKATSYSPMSSDSNVASRQ